MIMKKILFILACLFSVANAASVVVNEGGASNIDYRVETDTIDGAISTSANIDEVYFLRNGEAQAIVSYISESKVTIVVVASASP